MKVLIKYSFDFFYFREDFEIPDEDNEEEIIRRRRLQREELKKVKVGFRFSVFIFIFIKKLMEVQTIDESSVDCDTITNSKPTADDEDAQATYLNKCIDIETEKLDFEKSVEDKRNATIDGNICVLIRIISTTRFFD